MLIRLTYLAVTNAFALLRLIPISDHDKDAEILVLRHQITVLQRQLAPDKVRFAAADRAFLAALLHRLPRPMLRTLPLLVRPDTILRWHLRRPEIRRRSSGGLRELPLRSSPGGHLAAVQAVSDAPVCPGRGAAT